MSSEASASCCMARSRRGGVHVRSAAPTSFSRLKCTGGAPRFMANSIESPPSTARPPAGGAVTPACERQGRAPPPPPHHVGKLDRLLVLGVERELADLVAR